MIRQNVSVSVKKIEESILLLDQVQDAVGFVFDGSDEFNNFVDSLKSAIEQFRESRVYKSAVYRLGD